MQYVHHLPVEGASQSNGLPNPSNDDSTMQSFLDVEMAPEDGKPKPTKPVAPLCRSSSSHSKRKSRPNVRRSFSSRKRYMRAARSRFAKHYAPLARNALLSTDQTLTLKRLLRALRPFAPFIGRALFLAFFIGHFVRALRSDWEGYESEVEMGFGFLACISATMFLLSVPDDNGSFAALVAYFIYRCFLEPKRSGMWAMQTLCLTSAKLLGLCRAVPPLRRSAGDSSSNVQTSVRDVVLLATRCATGFFLMEISVHALGTGKSHFLLQWLLGIPVASLFAFGYCFRKAAVLTAVYASLLPTYLLLAHLNSPRLGLEGLDALPFIASSILMAASDGGNIPVDSLLQRSERLVF